MYTFPINLSEEIYRTAIVYGTVVPIAVVPNPFLQMEKGKYVNLLIMSNNCTLIRLQTFSFWAFSSQNARPGPSKVIDVTVPVQCQVADSRLFIIESSKVREPASRVGGGGGVW